MFKALQNLEVNCTPQSETMLSGIPCNFNISVMKTEAVSVAEGVPIKGTKFTILVRQSITTKMILKSSDEGRTTIKSIEIILHGFSCTGRDSSSRQVLALSDLLCRHIKQDFIYFFCNPALNLDIRRNRSSSLQCCGFQSDQGVIMTSLKDGNPKLFENKDLFIMKVKAFLRLKRHNSRGWLVYNSCLYFRSAEEVGNPWPEK